MGQQVADLAAFDAEDPSDRFESKFTYRREHKVRVTTGDTLYTSTGEPILIITHDDCGIHDMLFAQCTSWVLNDYYGQEKQNGCRENIQEVVQELDVDPNPVHNTLNLFMKSTVAEQTYVDIREPESEPGDTVVFEADRDTIVGIASCTGESTVNAGELDPIDICVPDGTEVITNF